MAMDFSTEADDEGDTNAFKLFGSSIPFFGYGLDPERSSRKDDATSMAGICHKSPVCVLDRGKVPKDGLQNEDDDGKEEEESPKEATISTNNNGDRELQEEPACPPSLSSPSLPTQGEEGEANENEKREKKKPEKLLPCPRCDSLTTKFCYFNNGNVRQPRHFCKRCQRYWTAGGALRNLPVGSGRRKSKNSSSSYPPTPTPPPPPPGYLNLTEGLFVASDAVDPLSASGTTPESTFPARNQKETATHFCRNQPANGRIEQSASGQQQYSWAANSLISNGSCETCSSNEMAFSSSQSFPLKDAQACGTTKEVSKQPYSAEGLMMGRSPFSYPMGPWPYYGYGLFGWNNGGGFTATPWLGQPGLPWGLPWPLMPFPLWPPCGWGAQPSNIPPPWGHATQSMASTSGTYGADNPIWGNRPGEGLLPTDNPSLGKHPTEGLATSNPLLGKHPREGLLPTNNPFLGNYPTGGLPTDNPIWGKHHPREGLRTDNPILGIHPGEGLFPTENPIFGKHPIEGLSTDNPFLGKHPREGLWPTDSPIFGKHPTEGLLLTDNPIWGKHHPREGLPTDNPVLGKHPREGLPTDNPILSKQPREGLLLPTYAESNGCLLTPKTLRLQDPQEAAQSSIWSSLGLDKS